MTSTPPKKHFIGISLKMYFTPTQTIQYATTLLRALNTTTLPPNLTIFLIPDFLTLPTLSNLLYPPLPHQPQTPSTPLKQQILLGAQNCFYEDSGAYTGEISPKNLKSINCSIIELGHAERRRLFGETDEIVAKKVNAVLKNSMIPLICIGETSPTTNPTIAISEMKTQVLSVLDVLKGYPRTGDERKEIIFAYEPVWAIGAERPAESGYVVGVVEELRAMVGERGEGGRVSFIYGGSAGRGTWEGLKEGVDGLFLGRFAHDVGAVMDIIDEVAKS